MKKLPKGFNWKYRLSDIKGPLNELICPHRIGHDEGVHGCDGCCSKVFNYERDHSHIHCYDQDSPPCGLKGKHRCCLCEKPVPEPKKCISNDMVYLSNPVQNRCKVCGQFWFPSEGTPNCKNVEINTIFPVHPSSSYQ